MTQLYAEVAPGHAEPAKAFSNARKLFPISDLPIGALTYGGGNIGKRSRESFVNEFSESLLSEDRKKLSVEEVANNLLAFVRGHYEKAHADIPAGNRPATGFYVAGYSPGKHLGSESEFVLPTDSKARNARPDEQFGASWRGVSVPFSRLHFGVDPRLPEFLLNKGVPADMIAKIRLKTLRRTRAGLSTSRTLDQRPSL